TLTHRHPPPQIFSAWPPCVHWLHAWGPCGKSYRYSALTGAGLGVAARAVRRWAMRPNRATARPRIETPEMTYRAGRKPASRAAAEACAPPLAVTTAVTTASTTAPPTCTDVFSNPPAKP